MALSPYLAGASSYSFNSGRLKPAHHLLICETKARNDAGSDEVKAKAKAEAAWSRHVSEHAQKINTKPLKHLLISHEQVTEDKRLADFLLSEVKPR